MVWIGDDGEQHRHDQTVSVWGDGKLLGGSLDKSLDEAHHHIDRIDV
jgi:hypothetical protein